MIKTLFSKWFGKKEGTTHPLNPSPLVVDILKWIRSLETCEDAVLSRFNLTNHNKYLGCALNVEFNGKYLLIGTHKFYPDPEEPDDFAYRVQLSEVKYKTGLCDRFCARLLTLVDVLCYLGKNDLRIRVIL